MIDIEMFIKILLFANLREQVGQDEFELELPVGSTILDALAALDDLTKTPISQMGFMVAVNRHYVLRITELNDGDELALIPPVSGGAVDFENKIHASTTTAPLNPAEIAELVTAPELGAVLTFCGQVRNETDGRAVRHLYYEAFEPMASNVMRWLVKRLEGEHPIANVAIVHRLGKVKVGEIAVILAVATPHRRDALALVEKIMDEVKTIVPIWKKEHFEDGEAKWGGAG